MKLSGRVAIVTGAGSGIGRATALCFAREGANVVVPDLNREASEQTADLIEKLGRQAISVQADVSKSEEVRSFVDLAVQRFGRIDILVNNAGIRLVKKFVDVTDEEWQREIGIDLTGPFYCIREVVPHMIRQGWGRIINIGSAASLQAFPDRVAYCAAKGGILTLTKAVALDVAGTGITVNMVAPGWVLTGISRPEEEAAVRAIMPFGRRSKPEEIAEPILFLASEEAGFISGATLAVDGALTAGRKY